MASRRNNNWVIQLGWQRAVLLIWRWHSRNTVIYWLFDDNKIANATREIPNGIYIDKQRLNSTHSHMKWAMIDCDIIIINLIEGFTNTLMSQFAPCTLRACVFVCGLRAKITTFPLLIKCKHCLKSARWRCAKLNKCHREMKQKNRNDFYPTVKWC